MKLYDIDAAIMGCIDQETGEIVDPVYLDQLQMARKDKIEGVACWVKNLRSDVKELAEEERAFKERKLSTQRRLDGLENWLAYALSGECLETPKVKISYRQSTQVDAGEEFINWAKENGEQYLKYNEPSIDKAALKEDLKLGKEFPGARLVANNNMQIK